MSESLIKKGVFFRLRKRIRVSTYVVWFYILTNAILTHLVKCSNRLIKAFTVVFIFQSLSKSLSLYLSHSLNIILSSLPLYFLYSSLSLTNRLSGQSHRPCRSLSIFKKSRKKSQEYFYWHYQQRWSLPLERTCDWRVRSWDSGSHEAGRWC